MLLSNIGTTLNAFAALLQRSPTPHLKVHPYLFSPMALLLKSLLLLRGAGFIFYNRRGVLSGKTGDRFLYQQYRRAACCYLVLSIRCNIYTDSDNAQNISYIQNALRLPMLSYLLLLGGSLTTFEVPYSMLL